MLRTGDGGVNARAESAADCFRRLRRLGRGEDRSHRPLGKIVLGRGRRRLLDLLAMEAIIAEEERRLGGLPPRLAALLGRPAAAS